LLSEKEGWYGLYVGIGNRSESPTTRGIRFALRFNNTNSANSIIMDSVDNFKSSKFVGFKDVVFLKPDEEQLAGFLNEKDIMSVSVFLQLLEAEKVDDGKNSVISQDE
jgi:hypothetical protein